MAALTPVLIITPYFAPQTHAAMFRVHKLAKYLPDHGYRPVVVATDVNYLYNEDPTLLDELPEVIEIHRARHVEPTIRGLRMALGGRDRSFAALKREGRFEGGGDNMGSQPARQSLVRRGAGLAYTAVMAAASDWPDRHWTWSRPLKRMCQELIQSQNIQLMYTTANPISPLAVAADLKREFGLKWVADNRDPIGYGRKHTADGILRGALERRYIQRSMDESDAVTGLADSYGNIFFDLYGLPAHRYSFIPTGVDTDYCSAHETRDEKRQTLLFVGEVMPNQSPYVFQVLAHARTLAPEVCDAISITILGRREVNEPLIRRMIADLTDGSFDMEFVDHVPQQEVYRRIRAARACLHVPGRRGYWWNNFAKMVDYIGLGVPVIADVPEISEARSELTKAGNALFLEGDMEGDAQALLAWLKSSEVQDPSSYSERYTARRQVAEFAAVFDTLRNEARQ